MSELEELPSWAGRNTEEVSLPPKEPDEADAAVAEGAAIAGAAGATAEAATDAVADAASDTADAAADVTEVIGEAATPPLPPSAPPELPRAETTQMADIAAPTAAATSALATETAPVQAAYATNAGAPPRRRRRLRTVLLALLGIAVLAGAGAGGYFLAASQDSDETAATDGAATEAAVDDDASPDPAGAATTDDEATSTDEDGTATDGAATDEAEGDDAEGSQTVTVEVDEDGAEGDSADGTTDGDDATDGEAATGDQTDSGDDALNDGNRQAFFRGGQVYLTGAVPSEEVADLIVERAAAVVGPDNVINEYTIDPTVTIQPGESAPLYVEDVILFEFNSVEIASPFLPILDLGTLLLRQNPQASVTVVTRTDAVGSEEVNLEVSQRRAQAVINYWLGQGVNRDQILADPRGEEGASEDDDAETAAKQRRAEFIITGLLD